MPNIRILAIAVFKIFCSQGCSYTKCLCPKKRNNSTEKIRNRFKVNQLIYILVCNYMPNIRILAIAVLKIFCSQGFSYIVEKGHNSRTTGLVEEKKIRVRFFFMYMPYIKFQDSRITGSRVSQLPSITDRQTDRRTDRRTDGQAQTNMHPLNFSEVGGKNRFFRGEGRERGRGAE